MQKTFTVEEINNYLSLFSEIVIPHATEEAIVKANRIKRYISGDVKFNHPVNIHVGDRVVVVDGSGMIATSGNSVGGIYSVSGMYFRKNGEYEMLTVEKINYPYPTDYGFPNVLGHHNNCKIRGYDGNVYYCSLINIRRIN